MTNDPKDELKSARRKRTKRELGDAILQDLGMPGAGALGVTIGTAPEVIQDAVMEAAERSQLYASVDLRRAQEREARGIRPEACFNSVCSDNTYNTGGIDGNVCKDGVQSCRFRMQEAPPSDPFSDTPSHVEAVRMLQRLGALKPDQFGKWNGTDFAQRSSTNKLWWAYIALLIETGKIPEHVIEFEDGEKMQDKGKQGDDALVQLGLGKKESS